MSQPTAFNRSNLRTGDIQALVRIGGWNRDTLYSGGICRLFSCESGGVHALVVGPRFGHCWKQVYYYRWASAENQATRYVPVYPVRESDQRLLRACVNKVNKWLAETATT